MSAPSPSDPPVSPELLLTQRGWVQALARTLVGDADDAEDLAQDTLLSALARPPRLAGGARDLRSWLATVMRRTRRDRARAGVHARERERASARPERAVAADPAQALERAETHRLLVEALLGLDEPFRSVLVLRYFEGDGPDAIAARLGVPRDTVRSRLRRGLRQLRARLAASAPDEHGAARPLPALLAPLLTPTPTPAEALRLPLTLMALHAKWKLAATALVLALAGLTLPHWLGSPEPTPPTEPWIADDTPAQPAARPDRAPTSPDAQPRVDVHPAQGSVASADPTASGAALFLLRGRVVDLEGRPQVAIPLVFRPETGGEQPLASDAAGRFEARVPRASGFVYAADSAHTTLLAGHVDPDGVHEPVVVLAAGAALEGRIVDPDGRPIADAEVELTLSRAYQHRLSLVLDAAHEPEYLARSDAGGRFQVADFPRGLAGQYRAQATGFVPGDGDLAAAKRDLAIVLTPVAGAGAALVGVVLDPAGEPVADARVAAGFEVVRTDADGAFAFPPAVRARADEVVALAAGFLPARATRIEGAGDGWPAELVLRVDGAPLALSGVVRDGAGEPRAGVRVYLVDPTSAGIEEDAPTQVESALAGLASKAEVERAGEELTDTPSSFWTWVTTRADGRFELTGLLDREYRVRAFDPRTLALADSEPVRAGATGVTLLLPRDARALSGLVVDDAGAPLEGARLGTRRRAFEVEGKEGGAHGWDPSGPGATTDADGRFDLAPVAPEAYVHVSADGFRSRRIAARDLDRGKLIPLRPRDAPRGHFQILGAPPSAAHFELHADGEPLPLTLRRGGFGHSSARYDLLDGRSLVLSVPAGALELVLFDASGTQLARTPVTILPNELTFL